MKRSAILLTAVLAAPATASAKPLNLKISQVANATIRGVPAGAAMADAGDVNGDGLPDLVVGGGPAGRRSSSNSAFVIFGRRGPFTADLRSLGRGGIRIDGAVLDDGTGAAVAAAGDVDGDGLADVLVGSPGARGGAGSVELLLGRKAPGAIDLSDDAAAALRVDGAVPGEQLGASLAGVGDVDGDGRPDFAAGAPGGHGGNGGALVVFGRALPGGIISERDLGDRALAIGGAAFGDLAGTSVAGAGDINGDGHQDVIVGAPSAYLGGLGDTNQGIAYVVFGRGPGTVELDALRRGGFRIVGDYGGTGRAVAGTGDVNGDGRPDVAVTSYVPSSSDCDYDSCANTKGTVGAALVFGSTSTADVALADPVPRFVRLFSGGGQVLPSVARLGDLNGDRRAEVLSAGPAGSAGAAAYLTYGRRGVRDGYDVRFGGVRANAATGVQVAGLGDLNGDGRPEMVFATGPSGGTAGQARIVFGFAKPRGRCANQRRGTPDDDVLAATSAGDRIVAGDGNDVVRAFAGADCVTGGAGRDALDGGAGNDRI
ncbi:MAG: hypothetical protein QOH62_2849 [Solirubrobacteraceae bacterium]|nr:hypothetical protein [Solirubrobacteraceae bacterium]